jgi:hypothetical protein
MECTYCLSNNATLSLKSKSGTKYFCIEYTSTEPLIAPPFIWNQTLSNKAGIYGIQNLSIVANYGSLFKAVKLSFISGVADVDTYAGTTSSFSLPALNNITQVVNNADLLMKYITPHSTDIMAQRNVVPYLEYPRFISSNFSMNPGSNQPFSSTLANAPPTDSTP